jgi:hypothetical protein
MYEEDARAFAVALYIDHGNIPISISSFCYATAASSWAFGLQGGWVLERAFYIHHQGVGGAVPVRRTGK